jgi:prepilin-type N-terminal cleavage/methylation domain-containing protein
LVGGRAERLIMKRPSFNQQVQGFSLIELMVVVALIAGLILIALPSLNALGGLDLKKEITKLAGFTSEVFSKALLSGKTHRIVFDLDDQKYWVEEKAGEVGEINPELGYEELMKERIKENLSDEEDNLAPKFKAVKGTFGEKQSLAHNVVFFGVWTEQMPEIARKGQAMIYFFSDGYTQSAFVSIAKKGDDVDGAFYLSLSPLTGKAYINIGEPDTNKLKEGDN